MRKNHKDVDGERRKLVKVAAEAAAKLAADRSPLGRVSEVVRTGKELSGDRRLSRRQFLAATSVAAGAALAGLAIGSDEAAAEGPSMPVADWERYVSPSLVEKVEKYSWCKRIPTICPYCSCGCGMLAMVAEDGTLVEVEGDPYHPINEGALCSKGSAALQYYRNPNRLKYPMKRTNPKKGKTEDPGWVSITWDEAYSTIAEKVKAARAKMTVKDASGNYFYTGKDATIAWYGSSYWNNEECYLGRKLISLLGSHNVEHQARKCHASTVMGLANTFGFGAQTNHYIDLKNCKRIILMSNPAENHPMAMKWIEKAKRENGAKVIYLDPRFGRSVAYADVAAHFRSGTDVAIYWGILRYLINDKPDRIDWNFLYTRTNAPHKIDGTKLADPDWKTSPDSNFGRLKALVEPYTFDEVYSITGIPPDTFGKIAEMYTEEKPSCICYAMGVTQHTNATQMVRAMAVLQLCLGNLGRPGGGVNAMRGISNVQGSTDQNLLNHLIMGYRSPPRNLDDARRYQKWKNGEWNAAATPPKWVPKNSTRGGVAVTFSPEADATNPDDPEYKAAFYKPKDKIEERWDARMFPTWNSLEYNWGIYVGTHPGTQPDTKDGDGAFVEKVVCDLPIGAGNATVQLFRAIKDKKIDVFIGVGTNNIVSEPNSTLVQEALSREDLFTVIFELFENETAHFADIVLPASVQVEREGSITNSGRWIQWRWKAVEPPHMCKDDFLFVVELYRKIRAVGAKLPSEVFKDDTGNDLGTCVDICWPSPYGDAVVDVYREMCASKADAPKLVGKKVTEQPAANVLYKNGYDYDKRPDLGGVLAKRRDARPTSDNDRKYGWFKNWAYSWMLNQRNLYDLNEEQPGVKTFFAWWATSPTVWLGLDCAGIWSKPLYDTAGVDKLITDGKFKGTKEQHPLYHGIPVHTEPAESPVQAIADKYPTLWDERFAVTKGSPADYPCVLTTFRLTEHMQAGAMTRHLPWLCELQPEMFVELSKEHAASLGVKTGDRVTVSTARGSVDVKANVSDRLNPLNVGGGKVHIVAMPWHWGFKGLSKGATANDITIDAVDVTANIPEYKACICKVAKKGV